MSEHNYMLCLESENQRATFNFYFTSLKHFFKIYYCNGLSCTLHQILFVNSNLYIMNDILKLCIVRNSSYSNDCPL
jgi:hypothetical protein